MGYKNRDDMYLAKAAGEDVDVTTITPPVPVSDREKLYLKLDERLSGAEEGSGSGGGGVLVVNATDVGDDTVSDKSFAEVEAAINNGKAVLLNYGGDVFITGGIYDDESPYLRFLRFDVGLDDSPYMNYCELRLGSESNVLIYTDQAFALTPLE